MNKKKITPLNISWWLDIGILQSNLKFHYSLINNTYNIKINNAVLYFFFLLNKKNTNTLNFYILDIVSLPIKTYYQYFISYQSIFFDYKVLVQTQFTKKTTSLSTIYNGALWIERETKEFNELQYNNILDTRKLLSNYNYNSSLEYNNFNNIINDLNI